MSVLAKSLSVLALLAASSLAAHADSFSFSYGYGDVSASGIFTGTAQGNGSFLITGATGKRDGVKITGIDPVGTGGYTDNLLFPGDKVPVDFNGITFELANGKDINLYASDSVAPGFTREFIDFTTERPAHSGFTVEIDPLVTPEPSSLVLLGTGLITAAGFVRRRFVRA